MVNILPMGKFVITVTGKTHFKKRCPRNRQSLNEIEQTKT